MYKRFIKMLRHEINILFDLTMEREMTVKSQTADDERERMAETSTLKNFSQTNSNSSTPLIN